MKARVSIRIPKMGGTATEPSSAAPGTGGAATSAASRRKKLLAYTAPKITDVLGQAKVTAVVVLDNSYSMDLRGLDKKSAFQKARAAAKERQLAPTSARNCAGPASTTTRSECRHRDSQE